MNMNKNIVKVDLCCGSNKPEGFIGVDTVKCSGVDIVANLNKRFPFKNNYVDLLRAHDAIEHLPDKIHTMNEIWRICKNGAIVDIQVPSTDGRGAFQDPTHISYWNINSFFYYTSNSPVLFELSKRYGFKGNFKIESVYNIGSIDGVIHVIAKLIVVKE
jgi:predicted SAM-dependent methyltransferase